MLNLEELFEKHEDEFLKFERETAPRHPRRDLCAFLMLHELDPSEKRERPMISSAEHDEIWLDADVDTVAVHANEQQIVTLIRCGVRFDEGTWAFAMFV